MSKKKDAAKALAADQLVELMEAKDLKVEDLIDALDRAGKIMSCGYCNGNTLKGPHCAGCGAL